MNTYAVPASPDNRLTALLLALFFGLLGVHRMYVGKMGSGITMLLFTLSGIGLAVSIVWAMVDIICILTGAFRDSDGRRLTSWMH